MANPVFTQHNDGSVTVDHFPDELVITRQLLDEARPRILRWTGHDSFRIVCANATAEYRIIGPGEYPETSLCQKVSQ